MVMVLPSFRVSSHFSHVRPFLVSGPRSLQVESVWIELAQGFFELNECSTCGRLRAIGLIWSALNSIYIFCACINMYDTCLALSIIMDISRPLVDIFMRLWGSEKKIFPVKSPAWFFVVPVKSAENG